MTADHIFVQNQTNQEFLNDELVKREQLVQSRILYADHTIGDISKSLKEAEDKALNEAEELYHEFKTSKEVVKSMLVENRRSHNQTIRGIHEQANQ